MTPESCTICKLRPALCHGVDADLGLSGCAAFDHRLCEEHEWTCICNPVRFVERFREVGGFACKSNERFRDVPPLPVYIPTYYHDFSHAKPLDIGWIAVPLHTLIKTLPDGTLGFIAETRQQLRELLGVQANTKIIVTGPGPDQGLEDFWRFHKKANLLTLMVSLGIEAFTVPNYSLFLDSPPPHHRYNRSRILRMAERASAAGLSTVLHLNALHEEEWRDLEQFLLAHPEIKVVCMEFQTGYKSPTIGDRAFNRLVTLQRNIKRPIHPILIGAARYAMRLGKNFETGTIIDAQPFLHTFNRKMCVVHSDGRITWNFHRSHRIEIMAGRFMVNLRTYSDRIAGRMRGTEPLGQRDLLLRLPPSKPPVVRGKQQPLNNSPLFCQKPSEHTTPPVQKVSSEFPNRSLAEPRIAIAIAPIPSRGGLSATRPNSHHKNIPDRLQPNVSGLMKKVDEEDGH